VGMIKYFVEQKPADAAEIICCVALPDTFLPQIEEHLKPKAVNVYASPS